MTDFSFRIPPTLVISILTIASIQAQGRYLFGMFAGQEMSEVIHPRHKLNASKPRFGFSPKGFLRFQLRIAFSSKPNIQPFNRDSA